LQEAAFALFARAGLPLQQARGERDYRGSIAGLPDVEVTFLSAGEIASRLAAGQLHLGLTGEDLIHEGLEAPEQAVSTISQLGFGHANVVVAVPRAWIDVDTMADLEQIAADFHQRHGRRLRVATKYVHLTRRFFAQHGVADYRIVESAGATEGAPAAGTAELIVDITTSGATLEANALKVLSDGTMLRSQASLIAALKAPWSGSALATARAMLRRLSAEAAARQGRRLLVWGDAAVAEAATEHARRLGSTARGDAAGAGLGFMVPAAEAARIADALMEASAAEVVVQAPDYAFAAHSELEQRLLTAVGNQ
jgi:ATP phosphoribosyltransferase